MITIELNEFGLREKDLEFMFNLFKQHSEIERVLLYGSRAYGNYELGSDVDLALAGKNITPQIVNHIHYILEEESPTPLWFDVVHFNAIKNIKLKEEIDSFGKVIYNKA
jgi:predicted nucleotidyltransferase